MNSLTDKLVLENLPKGLMCLASFLMLVGGVLPLAVTASGIGGDNENRIYVLLINTTAHKHCSDLRTAHYVCRSDVIGKHHIAGSGYFG